jgi:hypothetical protein
LTGFDVFEEKEDCNDPQWVVLPGFETLACTILLELQSERNLRFWKKASGNLENRVAVSFHSPAPTKANHAPHVESVREANPEDQLKI